jgi:hypothetical protein
MALGAEALGHALLPLAVSLERAQLLTTRFIRAGKTLLMIKGSAE